MGARAGARWLADHGEGSALASATRTTRPHRRRAGRRRGGAARLARFKDYEKHSIFASF